MTDTQPQKIHLGELNASHRGHKIRIDRDGGYGLTGQLDQVYHHATDGQARTRVVVVWWGGTQITVELSSEDLVSVEPE